MFRRREIVIIIAIFLIALIPRVLDLGTFLTADEKTWIGRSYEYIRAFKDLRFNDMLQTTHPGATTLWLSGAAVTATILLKHILFTPENLPHFIWPTQFTIALLNSLLVPLIYIFLYKLFKNQPLAIIASLFIALDPFIIGYSRVVHVDALVAGFMLLAALAMMIYVDQAYSKRWLIVSAVFSALALLTKLPAIFLLPFFVLVILTTGFSKARVKDFFVWLGIIVLLFFIIWPVFIVVPDTTGNILTVKRDVVIAASTPHDMTESYSLNASHYLFTLVTRLNPVVQILSLLFLILLLFNTNLRTKYNLLLIAYIFFFIVMMTIGAKKGDRYILPVFPVFSILAAVGIQKMPWRKVAAVFAVLILAITVYYYHPYAIAYSNPFFKDNLSQEVGWGEGLEQVGAWLNTNAPRAHVASWYPEELGAFTTAPVAHINAHQQTNVRYVVLYRNMFGRAKDHPANDFIDEYYKKRNPVFIATIHNKQFAWVYEKLAFETNVGELLPGSQVEQVLTPNQPLAGIDIFFATYTGRANTGTVHVELENIYSWTIPVKNLKDDSWQTLVLPELYTKINTPVIIRISASGTSPKNAPTVRSTKIYAGEEGRTLAVRLRYSPNATEEDTRLFTKNNQ